MCWLHWLALWNTATSFPTTAGDMSANKLCRCALAEPRYFLEKCFSGFSASASTISLANRTYPIMMLIVLQLLLETGSG